MSLFMGSLRAVRCGADYSTGPVPLVGPGTSGTAEGLGEGRPQDGQHGEILEAARLLRR